MCPNLVCNGTKIARDGSRPHLGKVLGDGSQGLTPWRVLHQDAEVGVGEPAAPHPLPLGDAGRRKRNILVELIVLADVILHNITTTKHPPGFQLT